MSFVYSKGYLVSDDLPWTCQEYLQGSEHVNDVTSLNVDAALTTEKTFGIYGTNADLVVVILQDALGTVTNTLAGFASLPGGFSKVAVAGDTIYGLSKSDPTKIYRIKLGYLNGGDSTANLSLYVSQSVVISDIHGDTIGDDDFLYIASSDGTRHFVTIHNLSTGTSYSTTVGDSAESGGFLKGSWRGNLYWGHGGQVWVHNSPETVSADGFIFDMSYGAVNDDFSGGTIDDRKWVITKSGTMTACFSQDEGLDFSTTVSGPGAASSQALYLARCVGDIHVQCTVDVDTWPLIDTDQNVFLAMELVSANLKTRYRAIRGKNGNGPGGHYFRWEVYEEGDLIASETVQVGEIGVFAAPFVIEVWREPGSTQDGRRIRFGISNPGGGMDVFSYEHLNGDDSGFSPVIEVSNDTENIFSGTITQFGTGIYGQGPAIYKDLKDEDIRCAGVSSTYGAESKERTIALGYASGVQFVRTDEEDAGGKSESDAEVSALLTRDAGFVNSSSLVAACVSSNGESVFFGGESGISQINSSDASSPVWMRDYALAYDHAQPLTWKDVLTLDHAPYGFLYGAAVSMGTYGYGGVFAYGDPYDPRDFYGDFYVGSGGGGYITPDFTAPLGTDAFAHGRNANEVATGANTPNPIPADYLHAHLERRLTVGTSPPGAWNRLKEDGWRLHDPEGWDHNTDVAFLRDEALGDIGTVIQDEGLADGKYEYRWVFHDEAGNQGELTAVTPYQNGAQYIDDPVINSLALNEGVSPTQERGVVCTINAHSGPGTGSEEGKVTQARFWNEGESESDSPWRQYVEGRAYPHRLSAGGGLKTVYARVRHECGRSSAARSATILYEESEIAPSGDEHENIMICFGEGLGYNFTGDGAELTADSEDSSFPAANVQQYDLGATWKSEGFGNVTDGGSYLEYRASLAFDLGVTKSIEVFAILGHNFAEMYDKVGGLYDFSVLLRGYEMSNGLPTGVVEVELGELRNRKVIVHRPQASRRYWDLIMRFKKPTDYLQMKGLSWTIGRIVLNEQALCFVPDHNYSDGFRAALRDPSRVSRTVGQARRVVELSPYREMDVIFRGLRPDEVSPIEVIWRRQRQIRPVLVVLDPHKIATGEEVPDLEEEATVIYGYLGSGLQITGSGWNHSDVRLRIEESVG